MFVVTVTGKPTMQEDEDGRRWIVVIAAFFVQFIICGISYSIGVFQIVFQDVFSIDYFDTSWAGSIQLYTTALTSKVTRGCNILHLSLILRKPVFGVFDQVRHKPGCISTEDG